MRSFASTAVALIVAGSGVARTTYANVPRASRIGQRPAAVSDTGLRAATLDSSLAIATFDSAWRTVGLSLEERGVTRIDWTAVRRELRPRAARAGSDSELRTVIADMLSRLGESHFAVLPPVPSAASDGPALGTIGVEPRLLDGQLVVWRVEAGSAGARAGIRPGWFVDRIDDVAVPTLGAADSIGPNRLAVLAGSSRALRGRPGSTVRVNLRDASGVRRDLTVTRDTIRGPFSKFGNLPPLPASVQTTQRTLSDGRCVAVIRFEYWMPPVMPAVDRAVDGARTCGGMILDLRGNLGGVAGMMMGVAGHFLGEPKTLGIMRTRGDEMRFVANPRRATDAGVAVEPFAGDLAILVDGLSASTSEMFAAAMQALGRARVFGERTAGQALPAMATRLPTGDVLMHVVADFVAPDGSQIEGRGVIPDEVVPLTRADLGLSRDAALEAAVRWMERARPNLP